MPLGARSCRYLVERPSYELIDNEAVSLAPCLKALPPFERNVKLLDELAGFLLEKLNYDVILFSQKPAPEGINRVAGRHDLERLSEDRLVFSFFMFALGS